jgi:hypothetical protein
MVKLTITNDNALPDHLGGHENETHLDDGALSYIMEKFGVKSMIDVGCGPGGMTELARSKGLEVLAIDGDFVVDRNIDDVVIHDYQVSAYKPDKNYDLAWCVEFVEHIEAQYIQYFVTTFQSCKYVIMTHAFPDQPGWHHVNCQPTEYWVAVMQAFGFEVDVVETNNIREASTMNQRYIRQQSIFLKNLRFGG